MSTHLITLKQDTEHHRCALPGEPWDIVTKFIEGGILVDLRRILKRRKCPFNYWPTSIVRVKTANCYHGGSPEEDSRPFCKSSGYMDIECFVSEPMFLSVLVREQHFEISVMPLGTREGKSVISRSTMIDKRHPLTRSYAPSLNRLKDAEKSHLVEHYNMIHPFSMFSLYFNMSVVMALIVHFVAGPLVYALMENKWKLNVIMLPINLVYVILIIITFCTGYYDGTHNIVNMKKGYVAVRYIQSYFFFDILSFIPQMMRFYQIDQILQRKGYDLIAPALIILRYARYIWCLKVLQTLRLYYGFSTFTYKALTLILHIIVGLVLSIYIVFSFLSDLPHHTVEVFLKHSESTLKMLMMVSNSRRHNSEHLSELLLSSVFIVLGFVLHLAILVQTTEIWSKYFNAGNQQAAVYDSINAYMQYKALPMTLRERIYIYLEFKYQGHFYKESAIKKATSNSLRREILLAATKKNVRNIDMFRKFPASLLRRIRSHLVSEIFLPGDIIIRAGNAGQCMFILVAGTVVVTTSEDREICHLRDGSNFGEVALAINLFRLSNVTAVTPCEIYKLDRHRFWSIMSKYPDLWQKVQNKAADQLSRSGEASSIVDTNAYLKEGNAC